MAPKFGTSGLRGLVRDMTPDLIRDYVRAFISTCPIGAGLFVAHDLRVSSPEIAKWVVAAGRAEGLNVTQCGAAPTPALALAALQAGSAAIMVTGSHIPADRNGLKFYTTDGEITKHHEATILDALGKNWSDQIGPNPHSADIVRGYLHRYQQSFKGSLNGMRIGVYGHSAVGRDHLVNLVQTLGGQATRLGWSDVFIPLDTEAVPSAVKSQLIDWAKHQQLDAIISTDADGDRPLMTDQQGHLIAGDVMGQVAAAFLGASTVVTPVSSNTGVEKCGAFEKVLRCKIGSPYVISGMEAGKGKRAGYEANGGFLLGFDALGPSGLIPRLMTRDAVLPMLAVLAASRNNKLEGVAGLIAAQPARFTAADRLENVPTSMSTGLVALLSENATARADFLRYLDATEDYLDLTDGLRIYCQDGRIVHLRPSGNAPELRLYIEADSFESAQCNLIDGLKLLRHALT